MKKNLPIIMALTLLFGGAAVSAKPSGETLASPFLYRGKSLSSEELPQFLNGIEAVRGARLDIALELLEPLAQQGVAEAQSALGQMLVTAENKSLAEQGVHWLQEAALRGDWQAQLALYDLYSNGTVVAQDVELAQHWLQQAAKHGGDDAQAAVVERNRLVLEQAHDALQRREFRAAEKLLTTAAQLGVVNAQETLGSLYHKGLLGENKKELARYWFSKAAAQGSKVAKFTLAMDTLDTPAASDDDKSQALRLLKQAAEPGEQHAQYRLGLMALKGELPGADPVQGVRWYRLAADQGHVEAQYALGVRYLLGLGDEKDANEAHRWFKRAAQQGHSKAQHNLALSYQHGIGTTPDAKLAKMWREKSLQPQAPQDELDLMPEASALLPEFETEHAIQQTNLTPLIKPTSKPDAKKNWFDTLPAEAYTLQLSSSLARVSAFELLDTLKLNKDKSFIYTTKVKGLTWHILQYGRFASVDEAKRFVATLRKSLPNLSPIVRKVKNVREQMAAQ